MQRNWNMTALRSSNTLFDRPWPSRQDLHISTSNQIDLSTFSGLYKVSVATHMSWAGLLLKFAACMRSKVPHM